LAAFFLYPHLGILAPRFSKEAKMSDIAAIHNTWLAAEAGEALRRIGVGVFAFAMVALGAKRSFLHETRRRCWGLNTTLFQ
jgi:hypothetical protein